MVILLLMRQGEVSRRFGALPGISQVAFGPIVMSEGNSLLVVLAGGNSLLEFRDPAVQGAAEGTHGRSSVYGDIQLTVIPLATLDNSGKPRRQQLFSLGRLAFCNQERGEVSRFPSKHGEKVAPHPVILGIIEEFQCERIPFGALRQKSSEYLRFILISRTSVIELLDQFRYTVGHIRCGLDPQLDQEVAYPSGHFWVGTFAG
jgi:hypothetical protein